MERVNLGINGIVCRWKDAPYTNVSVAGHGDPARPFLKAFEYYYPELIQRVRVVRAEPDSRCQRSKDLSQQALATLVSRRRLTNADWLVLCQTTPDRMCLNSPLPELVHHAPMHFADHFGLADVGDLAAVEALTAVSWLVQPKGRAILILTESLPVKVIEDPAIRTRRAYMSTACMEVVKDDAALEVIAVGRDDLAPGSIADLESFTKALRQRMEGFLKAVGTGHPDLVFVQNRWRVGAPLTDGMYRRSTCPELDLMSADVWVSLCDSLIARTSVQWSTSVLVASDYFSRLSFALLKLNHLPVVDFRDGSD